MNTYYALIVFVLAFDFSSSNVFKPLSQSPFINQCSQNSGNPNFEENFQQTNGDIQACIAPSINMNDLTNDLSFLMISGNYTHVSLLARKFCPKVSNISECIQPGVELLQTCFTDEEDKIVLKRAPDYVKALLDYICVNDGIHIFDFLSSGGISCIEANGEDVYSCKNGLRKSSLLPIKESISLDNEEFCDNWKTAMKCFLDILDKCSSSVPKEIITGLFDIMKEKGVHRCTF